MFGSYSPFAREISEQRRGKYADPFLI
jgi:hypothetical protein